MRKPIFDPKTIYYIYSGGTSFLFMLIGTIFSIYHIDMVNLNPFQLVIIGTILEASCFLFEIPTGVLADNYSRKLSIVIGMIVIGVGLFIEGFFPLFWIVALAQVVWGIGATFISGADVAWVSDETGGKNLDQTLLKAAQIRQVTSLLGIFVSIWLASFRVNLPFLVSGIGFVLFGLFLALTMRETQFKPNRQAGRVTDSGPKTGMWTTFRRGVAEVRKSSLLKALFLVVLFVGLFSEGFDRLYTFRFLKELNLPDLGAMNSLYWFAFISAGAILLNLTVLTLVKRRSDGAQPVVIVWLLFSMQLILNGAVFFFAIAGNFYLALGLYWLSYAMRHANGPLNDYLVNREITESGVRATVLSMRGQVDQMGQIIGGPVIGWIAATWSVSTGLVAASIILVPILFIYLYLIKHFRRPQN